MSLFPVTRPRLGVSLDSRRLALVELPPRWRRGWRLEPRPPGVRRWAQRVVLQEPTASAAHQASCVDIAPLIEALRELHGNRRRMVSAGLSLSDPCGCVTVVNFDTLPSKTGELEKVLRWRIEREFHIPSADARLMYRIFRQTAGENHGKLAARVLASLIGEPILQRYEDACLQAGLLPVAVGLSSLHLYDLCRPAIQRVTAQLVARESRTSVDEYFFVHWADWGFCFLAFRLGCPAFVRIKPWTVGRAEAGEPARPADGATPLLRELAATLQFYRETVGRAPHGSVRPLFLLVTAEGQAASDSEHADTVSPDCLRHSHVTVSPLHRESLFGHREAGSRSGLAEFPMTALPALAAVSAG